MTLYFKGFSVGDDPAFDYPLGADPAIAATLAETNDLVVIIADS